jgi:hypothetical protein
MGLDMYLSAKRYLWQANDEDQQLNRDIQQKVKINRRVKEITIEAMYWRKANQIHNWFVENVQNGEDECKSHDVSRQDLEKLLNACQAALELKDSDILPPKGGFFFGNTEIDGYYWNDIQETADEIKKILAEFDDSWEFEYCSSW